MADTLDFERKYRSAVIAWAPEDKPSDEQIEAVLDEFEKTAWAGLEQDRYAWAAVLLRKRGGGVHGDCQNFCVNGPRTHTGTRPSNTIDRWFRAPVQS